VNPLIRAKLRPWYEFLGNAILGIYLPVYEM